jgi:hypothetical protein
VRLTYRDAGGRTGTCLNVALHGLEAEDLIAAENHVERVHPDVRPDVQKRHPVPRQPKPRLRNLGTMKKVETSRAVAITA